MLKPKDMATLKDNDLHRVWPDKFPAAGEQVTIVSVGDLILAEWKCRGFLLPESCFVKVT